MSYPYSTYTDLQIAIKDWMDRSPGLVGVSSNADTIPQCIAFAEAFFNRKLRCREMVASTTLNPVSGSASLPSDFLQVVDVIYTGTPVDSLEELDDALFEKTFGDPNNTGPPKAYLIRGSTLYIGPVSGTALTFVYYQKIPPLASNSTNWLLSAHPDLYLFGALAEAEAFTEDANAAGLWKQRRDEVLDEVWRSGQFYRGPAQTLRVTGATP